MKFMEIFQQINQTIKHAGVFTSLKIMQYKHSNFMAFKYEINFI